MAGRKKKGSALQERLDKYLQDYELDDLNASNDMRALTQMCRLEVQMEKLNDALDKVKDPAIEFRQIKELTTALRDVTNSWTQLQNELGINRRKRQSEGDETPLTYIERLKEDAKNYLANRLKPVICPTCNLQLAKYIVYITEKGEEGSIASRAKPVEPISFIFKIECPRCGDGVSA